MNSPTWIRTGSWTNFLPSSKKLRISGPARLDLGRIGDYTRRAWGAAQKRKYLGQIKDGFKAVRDTPGSGTRRDDIRDGLRAYPGRKTLFEAIEDLQLTSTGGVDLRRLFSETARRAELPQLWALMPSIEIR